MAGVASTPPGLNHIWRLCTGLRYVCLRLACNAGHPLCGVQAGVGIVESPAQLFAVAQCMHFARANAHRGCSWVLVVKRFPIGSVQCVDTLPHARGLQH